MLSSRDLLEWQFKQLDHAVGLSFRSNFHFALVGHLIKGFRHPTASTVSRTSRVLTMLLGIVARPGQPDKFEVSADSVAYLTGKSYINGLLFLIFPNFHCLINICVFSYTTALVAVSEEVRSRCHVKHTLPRWPMDINLVANDTDVAGQAVSKFYPPLNAMIVV